MSKGFDQLRSIFAMSMAAAGSTGYIPHFMDSFWSTSTNACNYHPIGGKKIMSYKSGKKHQSLKTRSNNRKARRKH